MKRLRRFLLGPFIVIVAVIGGGYLWVRTAQVTTDGSIEVAGIEGTVTIARDTDGVPRITAGSERDAYFGLGFVHAQDRLWQMDFHRRLGSGRLAEIIGEKGLRTDRVMRTLGLRRLARKSLALLSPEARAAVESYSAGVNAFLTARSGAWPIEFYLLGYRPEAWQPADSLIWPRLMAMRLGRNWHKEALRVQLARRLPRERIDELWPAAENVPAVLSELFRGPAGEELQRLAGATRAAMTAALPPVQASNSWVLSGRHTASGKPLLAGDPHLAYTAPNLWYLARMEAPGFLRVGATVPGVPFTLLGHNGRIAWSFTNAPSDTQDLFIERIAAGRPDRYLTPTGTRPFTLRKEVIRVKDKADVIITVRETRHGPVISDVRPGLVRGGGKYVFALAAAALREDDRTAEALYRLGGAQDWQEFRRALRDFHSPHQSVTYADTRGNIAFIAPGRVPLRKAGNGLVPVPGWTGAYDWKGFIPFDDLPQALNPPAGRIVSANQRIVADSAPYPLGDDWAPGYRARRIHQMLDGNARHTADTMAAMQLDPVSLMARELLPLMLGVTAKDETARRALDMLRRWDGTMDRNRPEPLLFTAWLRELNRAIYADELGPDFASYWGLRPVFIGTVLTGKNHWCDDVATAAVESCAVQLTRALDAALGWLAARYGEDPAAWKWGIAHRATFRHPVLRHVPALGLLAGIDIEADGGLSTVNRGNMPISDPDDPFAAVHGAGYRAIYDLADLDGSWFIQATGQSGNPLSGLYHSLTTRWRDGKYLRMGPASGKGAGGGVLDLIPATSGAAAN